MAGFCQAGQTERRDSEAPPTTPLGPIGKKIEAYAVLRPPDPDDPITVGFAEAVSFALAEHLCLKQGLPILSQRAVCQKAVRDWNRCLATQVFMELLLDTGQGIATQKYYPCENAETFNCLTFRAVACPQENKFYTSIGFFGYFNSDNKIVEATLYGAGGMVAWAVINEEVKARQLFELIFHLVVEGQQYQERPY